MWLQLNKSENDLSPNVDGHIIALVGKTVYMTGGYKCVVNGVTNQGGNHCYNGEMWALDFSNFTFDASPQPNITWQSVWAPGPADQHAYR